MAKRRQSERGAARPAVVSLIQRSIAAGHESRGRIVRFQHSASGSKRERTADGGSHISQRTARATLRYYFCHRSSVPARGTAGSSTLGPAWEGSGPASDFLRGPHIPRVARPMGAGRTHGNAADAATTRCRHGLVHSQRGKTKDPPRKDGTASLETELQPVPRSHRSDRHGAGEL